MPPRGRAYSTKKGLVLPLGRKDKKGTQKGRKYEKMAILPPSLLHIIYCSLLRRS